MINKQNNNFGNNAVGINSTAVGYCTQTTNYGEFAAGILNKSTRGTNPNTPKAVAKDKNATLFSVGCGDDTGRKNAFEVKGDGSINISGVGNLQEKLKELTDVSGEITLKKNPNNPLQYTLYVGDKNCGEINIPKDLFLKSAEYNSDDKKLIFTFVTTDDDNVVTEISIADLVDTYKAGNNVTIKDNTISVDFSPITQALNTKVDKSDFDYVVKVNDDNKGNIINAKQVVNNQTTGVSNNYDLILGDKDNNDNYIQIDSTRSKNLDTNDSKKGNINICSNNSVCTDITSNYILQYNDGYSNNGEYSNYSNGHFTFGRNGCDLVLYPISPDSTSDNPKYLKDVSIRMSRDKGISISGGEKNDSQGEQGSVKLNGGNVTFNADNGMDKYAVIEQDYFTFLGRNIHKDGLKAVIEAKDSEYDGKAQVKLLSTNDSAALTIDPTTLKIFGKSVELQKDKNIKFRTSSSNTMRLTEGEGFKVFANMYAEPDHATDITDYTDEEKALLSSNTVQKNILDLNKKVNDVALSVPKLWINVCSTKDTALMVDGERVEIPAHRTTILYPTTSVYIADNTPNPECIKRFDIHNYGMFSQDFVFSANKTYTNGNGLFGCNVKNLNLSAWDTSKIKNFEQRFSMCKKLTSLDVSGWDVSNVNNMAFMFYNCAVLTSLDVSGWDVSNVTTMLNMFSYSGLNEIDLSNWELHNCYMARMFIECRSLKSAKLPKILTGELNGIFFKNVNLKTVEMGGRDTSKVTSFDQLFNECYSLTTLDMSGIDTSKVTSFYAMCRGCGSLPSLDVSSWDLSSATKIGIIFQYCTSLATLTFGESFGKMKDECGTLDLSELSAWNNDSVKSLLNLYDRKTNGMGVITIKLHANAKAVLGEDGIAELTAKGYTIA